MIALYSGLAIAISVGLALIIDNGIANPIIAMKTAMKTLAGGDKTIKIERQERSDKIGDMAEVVQVLKENIIKNDQMAEEQKVRQSVRNERAQRIEKPTPNFDCEASVTLNSVDEVADNINKTAISMTAIAKQSN